jgi:hypothetical protein
MSAGLKTRVQASGNINCWGLNDEYSRSWVFGIEKSTGIDMDVGVCTDVFEGRVKMCVGNQDSGD